MNQNIIAKLKTALDNADTVIIGAGAGLSTAAGYTYSGERFEKYFSDFRKKYGFSDMYSGGFYPYRTPEEQWGFWCRYIWINRYAPIPSDLYERILNLVKNKDYFVITTNVEHCFQRAGFDKNRLFYTQGDYGLFQDHDGEEPVTYDNEAVIRDMILSLGYEIDSDNNLIIPGGNKIRMEIPSELVPYDYSGKPMKMNLRADDTFVEDEGWHRAAERYMDFLKRHVSTKTVFLELGVGYNTPGIIKFPFWKLTSQWPDATYACLNYNEAYAPEEIIGRSIIISGDISDALDSL
ncbi:MAG: Sir2 silent information regulator family NAD-dependent deacetylase [Erysipelotrichaceae bacterium]|nr:Sir2 silent information regulator family NAD-dependent deacetylase [Erysipelotrichaceae bacterium]